MPTQENEDALDAILLSLQEAAEFKKFNKSSFFAPYPKQSEFFEMGATHSERLLKAGNQQGKTEAGAFETACHLTGKYPPWWKGRRFNHPVRMWIAGVSTTDVRDGPQRKLCGDPGVEGSLGTGFIPKECFVEKPSSQRGTTDAYDTMQIKHYTNGVYDGISIGKYKAYAQTRENFQGDTLHAIWNDEEPSIDIYTEELARLTATSGMIFVTFTPMKGYSDVVIRYLREYSPNRGVVTMTLKDALHMTPKMIEEQLEKYPLHERKARLDGDPMQGSGRIFIYVDEQIAEPAITKIPGHWRKLWAIDFGIDHPFAAVLLLHDLDNDVIHVHHAIRMVGQKPMEHARAMKPLGAMVPVAWPHDGDVREFSGTVVKDLYKDEGLRMLDERACFEDGSISTEAGIQLMDARMRTGRLKVANHLSPWFEEFREYHRKDGLIVKVRDDLMSATRIGIMMIRAAMQVPLGSVWNRGPGNQIADGVDFDLD